MVFIGGLLKNPRWLQYMQIQIPGVDRQRIDNFLARTSITLPELSNKLREEHALDGSYAYRYSSLREFPMIRFQHAGQKEIACPIPTLLFWRITTGLYYDLRTMPNFPTAFGRSFQDYVGEVLQARITDAKLMVLPEVEYQVGKLRKHTVDWIVQQGDQAALFLECKTKRLTWASKAAIGDFSKFEEDIRKLAGCVAQVYRTIRDYRYDTYPNLPFAENRQIYPAVVTLEDWYFFGREVPNRLDSDVRTAVTAAGLPEEWLDEMPYSIFSVDEFERAIGVMNVVGVDEFVAGKVRDPERRRWAYHSYTNDRYNEQVAGLPRLFRDEYDALFSKHGA